MKNTLDIRLMKEIFQLFLQAEKKENELVALINADSEDTSRIRDNLLPWCWWYRKLPRQVDSFKVEFPVFWFA